MGLPQCHGDLEELLPQPQTSPGSTEHNNASTQSPFPKWARITAIVLVAIDCIVVLASCLLLIEIGTFTFQLGYKVTDVFPLVFWSIFVHVSFGSNIMLILGATNKKHAAIKCWFICSIIRVIILGACASMVAAYVFFAESDVEEHARIFSRMTGISLDDGKRMVYHSPWFTMRYGPNGLPWCNIPLAVMSLVECTLLMVTWIPTGKFYRYLKSQSISV